MPSWRDAPIVQPASAPPSSGGSWRDAPVVQPADPNAGTETNFGLNRASGISETPWYARGMFGGYGPSVTDVIDTLPAVGGMVGGGLAAVSALPTGSLGAVAIPGAAALGGEGGEAWRQNLRRAIGAYAPPTSGAAATEIGRQGGIQAAAEIGGRAVARGASVALAPGARMVDAPVAAAEARLAAEGLTVELPAAARSTSRVVPVVEALTAKGVGGQEAAQRYVRAANSLTAMADHTVAQASKLTDDSARGRAIADGLDAFRSNWIKTKNALYKEAALPEQGITVQPRQTLAILQSVLADKASAGSVMRAGPIADDSFYAGLFQGLTKVIERPDGTKVRVMRAVEARDMLNAQRELAERLRTAHLDPFTAANKGTLKKIAATMDEEMKAAIAQKNPALAVKLETANAAYADGISKINSTYGKSIHTLAKAGKYDQIAKTIANARTSVDDIPRIMEVAGPEGTEAMQAAVIADLVAKAKNPQGQLTPQGLARAMKTFGNDRLDAILPAEQVTRLRDIATLTNSLQKGQKIMEGSQTAYLLSNMNVPAFLYHLGFSPVRRLLASPAGQRWMTGGYQPFTARQIERTATTAAHAGTLPFTAEDPE